MRREHRSNAQHSRWSGWSAVAWPGCRMRLVHPLLAGTFLAAGEGFEPSLTDPEGDVQPQKVQAAPPCSKSSTTLLCECSPRSARRGTVTRRRFVDVEQDRNDGASLLGAYSLSKSGSWATTAHHSFESFVARVLNLSCLATLPGSRCGTRRSGRRPLRGVACGGEWWS
jgi:hypothetical protein